MLFDTESDGLVDTATKIHCAAGVDVDTRDRFDWKPDQIDQFCETLSKATVVIGHNILRHDLPLLRKLKGFKLRPEVVVRDTMVCGRTIYPNVKETDQPLVFDGKMPVECKGKHTIEAWGYRLGEQKGDYSKLKAAEAVAKGITDPDAILRYTWGVWNLEMHEYMKQDVETNLALWDKLRIDNYSQTALDLEHRIAIVCDQMEKAGVPFDIAAAQKLHAKLITKKAEVEERLIATFGTWIAPISPTKAVFTPKKDNKKLGYVAGAPMTKLKYVTFNPGSRDHIAHVLLRKGWKPPKKTETGKPQIDEETVAGIVERYPEFAGLGAYLTIEKRLSQLADGKQAWLKVVRPDGHIHGVTNPMGTGTSRASHFYPNLAQVPAVKSPYGKECRDLFYAKPGWKIVGADQQGLELRALAHYLAKFDGGKYGQIVLNGDPHWAHAVAMDLAEGERDNKNQLHTIVREDGSKRFIYAYIYGCGDTKAGEIIFECVNKARLMCGPEGEAVFARFFDKVDVGERALAQAGRRVRNGFANKIEGFAKLKNTIAELVHKNGWIPGLDQRRIPIRSDHSALNFLIQSCGAIICKRWVVEAFEECCRRFHYNWEDPWQGQFVFVLWVHDEIQVWVREGIEEEVSKILVEQAAKAGESYGFRIRLDGEAKVGRTWAETH